MVRSDRPVVRAAARVAATTLVAVAAVVVALGAAGAPGATAAPVTRVSLTCPGLGELDLRLSAGAPEVATALPPGEHLVVRPAGAGAVAPRPGEVGCGVVAGPSGRMSTVGLTSDAGAAPAPSSTAAAAAPAPAAARDLPFSAAIRSYLAGRSGTASVAVYDARTGTTYTYASSTQYVTASIVKASILATVLRRARAANRSLTSSERSLATRMIEQSDNSAATSLWNDAGGTSGVQAFVDAAGMTSTTAGPGGLWGLTSTTAPDQVRLVRQVAYSGDVLADADRGYEESLMRSVTPPQRWGVTGGVPSSATVALKNGWLPHGTGWMINSIGHVRGGARDYAIAVLSSGSPSMAYGIATVEHLSSMVWSGLPLAPRRADLWGTLTAGSGSGTVEVHALSNASGLRSFALHRATAFAAVRPDDWAFALTPTGEDGALDPRLPQASAVDLVGVHLRGTASGRVEVHVLSAASGYRTFTRHAVTALAALDPAQWQVALGSVGGDGACDLVAVRTAGTATGRVEAHVLTQSSGYRAFRVHAVTPLPAGPGVGAAWRFLLGDGGNLVGVQHAGTASGLTEVHVLSWSSRWTAFARNVATRLGPTSDAQWRFALGDLDGDGAADLVAVRGAGGASGRVEAHVLPGATVFTTWLLHAATPLAAPASSAWRWSAS